jgi:glyoxylase-like metal-dependent hydrolase (beta-lactamase superfamily II)
VLQEFVKVLEKGDESGNNMPIRLTLPSGLEILGLPTENSYGGGWDLGPTWNYAVLADRPFLVDTGRRGMGLKLLKMMESNGLSGSELETILISHGHEDHDGGLFEMANLTGARIRAHHIYDRLIRFYPKGAPRDARRRFPASCWHCFMPESFSSQNCLEYQLDRSKLEIQEAGEGNLEDDQALDVYHVPGHSPDSLAILLAEEAIIVGDTVLPDISPFPSTEAFFPDVRQILRPEYSTAQSIYGLRAYIRSIKRLKEVGEKFPHLIVLPGHRLFYDNHWNEINLQVRVDELIAHHIQRCADILRILKRGPKTAKEIAVEHFEASLLEGFGILMAKNEIISHCELLSASGDVILTEEMQFVATGTANYVATIESLEPHSPHS